MGYKSPDGIMFDSYEAYCNSKDLDLDLVQCMLADGRRWPHNEFEESLLKTIQNARAEGQTLEIYPN